MTPKDRFRILFQNIRKKISPERRREAKRTAFLFLKDRLVPFQKILSFANTPEEIDLFSLNEWMCREKKLFLPKTHKKDLLIFRVNDLSSEMHPHPFFPILEPSEKLCQQVALSEIDCILVPGLAFDSSRYRLGYGKGYYDRLLEKTESHSIGVGYKEQMSPSPLPVEPHDQKLSELLLF